jgi:hypothetical protein
MKELVIAKVFSITAEWLPALLPGRERDRLIKLGSGFSFFRVLEFVRLRRLVSPEP